MSDEQPIIIKKIKKGGGHGHHGGAWKVAYADFVTAMMAFFLMMWLLSSTSEEQRAGLAEYFTPANVSTSTSGSDGMMDHKAMIQHVESAPPLPVDPGTKYEYEYNSEAESGPDDTNIQEINDETLDELNAQREAKQFNEAERIIREAMDQWGLGEFDDNVLIDETPEGLRIQIVDQENYSMFETGSDVMKPRTKELLDLVGQVIQQLPNKLSISGHTDSTPFNNGSQGDNWLLSSSRANESRKALSSSGVPEERIVRVVGHADKDHLLEDDPYSPKNRRISIVLLRKSFADYDR